MNRIAKRLLQILTTLIVLGLIVYIAYHFALKPWMDRWGATDAEVAAVLPGDELVPQPLSNVTRVVTVNASPEEIYPWLVQMGAGRGGLYSYSGFETYVLQCPLVNADRIHSEWQDLKVGDEVKMCPNSFGPPPYIVALLVPNQAVVMGHQENGKWVDLWQFVLQPQADGTTRLVHRDRTMAVGGFWDVIHPGIFIMERGMLLGIKTRAEGNLK